MVRCTGGPLLGLLCAAALLQVSYAAVHPYENEYFYSVGDAFIFRGGREGMWESKSEAVDEWGTVAKGINNGKSYIRFSKVQFFRPPSIAAEYGSTDGDTGLVQAVVFEVHDRDRIGYTTADGMTRRYCCTKELVAKTRCYPGRLIVQPHAGNEDWPWQTDIYFTDNDTVAYAVDEAVTITDTGMYYLWFVICDPNLAGVTISGQTTWKNPGGYLPGMMASYLPFFGLMSIAYLGVGFMWFVQYFRKWRDVMPLQNCITAVVALGMIEMSTWYFDYVNFNSTGFRPYDTTLWAVIVGSMRKTISRMLLLVVAMGYGVVRPTLGGLTSKVIALGTAYLIAACTLDVMTNVGTIDDLTSSARIFLVLPVAVLDAVFILWIFTALSKTLAQLQQRRQTAKLELYRHFTNTLAVAVVISVSWIAYEMYFKVTDQFNERWQSDWITGAFWHALNLSINAVICFLWRPNEASLQYAYGTDVSDDLDLEDAAPLKSSSSSQPSFAPHPPKVDTNVFSIDDEEGDGKMN
mmetsp:Transcript_1135/g.2014  ORF Transcript_1135/g.2014 Transcript_1135/m.2014 type:complete len:521 (-) Transcript_1135:1470-3032(-)|eukprot:CAMPEP_0198209054 /NCGR_PEP_ID=MMETSP1445-20131203/12374_1 /TAXON_ID=36898 /ORGANISM="Pyramimonas sp., Strain CCMP2087" /LENGTH=520 /DNA_ID=CAMNT_0043882683 /DNA_START=40 /DNA_END=1602 /DNA_ORIENTATION=+